MSGVRGRLAGALGGGPEMAVVELLTRRLDEFEERTRSELDRQDVLIREVAADLAERLAAIERRVAALEARDQ